MFVAVGKASKHTLTTSSVGGNGGLVFDVDGDGDLDIVAALTARDLTWWENPGANVKNLWIDHPIDDTLGNFNHDLVRVRIELGKPPIGRNTRGFKLRRCSLPFRGRSGGGSFWFGSAFSDPQSLAQVCGYRR